MNCVKGNEVTTPPRGPCGSSVHLYSSRRDRSVDFLLQVSAGVVLLEIEAAGIGVPMAAESKNVVHRERAEVIAKVIESPTHVMEMNFRPSLLPYSDAGISNDRVDVRDLQFRPIGVPHIE